MYEAKGAWLNGEDYPELVIGDEWEFNLSDNPDMPQQTNALFVSGNYLFQVISPNILRSLGLGLRADVMARVIGFREVKNPLPFDVFNEHGQFISDADYVRKYGDEPIVKLSTRKPAPKEKPKTRDGGSGYKG
jgi:hypothetical protein